MSKRMTLKDLPNAISSQELVDGATPCVSRCGLTIDLFGQEVVPASRSVRRAKERDLKTNGTSGQHGEALSPSAALQQFLENRLQAHRFGSTECAMIWRARITPSGRQYYQLAPLTRRIAATDSGLWPTPTSTLGTNGGRVTPTKARDGGTLIEALSARLWPTPQARDHFPPHNQDYIAAKRAMGHGMHNLNDRVSQLWPTPTAVTASGGAALCKWGVTRSRAKLRQAVTSAELNGALNPAFPCWLMGYPAVHLNLAPTATRLSRKSPKRS